MQLLKSVVLHPFLEATFVSASFGRITLRCSEPSRHKVLGRGRVGAAHLRAPSARVLSGRRPAADLGS
jgi:hypothetical protein